MLEFSYFLSPATPLLDLATPPRRPFASRECVYLVNKPEEAAKQESGVS